MSLPEPRPGDSLGFRLLPLQEDEVTLGDPEMIIWSSIKHMISFDIADRVLRSVHKIGKQSTRKTVAKNVKLYVEHAFEFYEAANAAKANTAPLFYYYSFLNLAKALCEIRHPKFRTKPESYRHGLSWRPDTQRVVNMKRESLSISTRGVWHVLWETLEGKKCAVANPVRLGVRELFSLCGSIEIEFEKTYRRLTPLIDLVKPHILINGPEKQVWLRFSVRRENLRQLRIFRPKLLDLIKYKTSTYRQVQSGDIGLWAFELERPKQLLRKSKDEWFDVMQSEIKQLNLFAHLQVDHLTYAIPIQTLLPITLSQLMVLYSLMFWLGSLVRYDPHSLSYLQDSEYWLLIDSFMNECRIWLLELFEWQLYKTETTLLFAR